MKLTNYIIAHKQFQVPQLESYVPLQVGSGPDLGYIRDNTGENIAERNPNFCELTGLYWIWKNDKTSDYVGIDHYRRYFSSRKVSQNPEDALSQSEIETLLKKWDVIVPAFEPYKETVFEQYCNESGFAEDLQKTEAVIAARHPEYLPAFKEVMKQGGLYQYNMVIMAKPLFDAYCQWLFDILFALEKQIDLTGYNPYQQRIYGFLSERLFNVWLKKQNLKVKQMPVIHTEMSRQEYSRLQLRRLRNRIQFRLRSQKQAAS